MTGWLALSDTGAAPHLPGAGRGAVLDHGRFVMELVLPPVAAVLLDYRAESCLPHTFSVFFDPQSGLSILHRQGPAVLRHSLPGPLHDDGGTARLVLHWDVAAGSWTLSLTAAGRVATAQGRHPVAMALADAQAMAGGRLAQRHAAVRWFGVAAGEADPPQALPWIGPRTPIATAAGLRPAAALRRGDLVLTRDRGLQPLHAVRQADQPAAGPFTPIRLRAPYFASAVDLLVSPDQPVALSGAEVDYLFGEDEVLAEARHLIDGRAALFEQRRTRTTSVTLSLGYPDLIVSQGCALASADPAPRSARRLLHGFEALPWLAMTGRLGARATT